MHIHTQTLSVCLGFVFKLVNTSGASPKWAINFKWQCEPPVNPRSPLSAPSPTPSPSPSPPATLFSCCLVTF